MTVQPPLTDLDREILDVVTRDPQASARMVAEALNLPLTQIAPRIRAMDRRKVSRVLAVMDMAASGQQICFLLIDVRHASVESVSAQIATIAQVTLVSTLLGGTHDLLVIISLQNVNGAERTAGEPDRQDWRRLSINRVRGSGYSPVPVAISSTRSWNRDVG